jgi:membrane-bound lytic murein transglycosylase D
MIFASARNFLVATMILSSLASEGQELPGKPIDPVVSLERAQALAASSVSEGGFSIVVNADVVAHLNRFLSKPWSKKSLKAALVRMESLRPMLEAATQEAGTPWELMAVPMVESAFRNPPQSANRWRSAGLWQFTRASARAHGLRVDAKHDERLDPEKSTRAALAYLKQNRDEFGSWPLALLAYNMGPSRIKKSIARSSTRDAFEILRSGVKGGDPEYLAKVMASALILKNPTLLD